MQIIEKAKINVSDKTLEKKYKEYAKAYGYEDVDALKKALEDAGNLENLEKTARLDIVEDWVADNCKQVKRTSSDSSKSGSNSTGSTGSTESTK